METLCKFPSEEINTYLLSFFPFEYVTVFTAVGEENSDPTTVFALTEPFNSPVHFPHNLPCNFSSGGELGPVRSCFILDIPSLPFAEKAENDLAR